MERSQQHAADWILETLRILTDYAQKTTPPRTLLHYNRWNPGIRNTKIVMILFKFGILNFVSSALERTNFHQGVETDDGRVEAAVGNRTWLLKTLTHSISRSLDMTTRPLSAFNDSRREIFMMLSSPL